jgi:hypothetical protein
MLPRWSSTYTAPEIIESLEGSGHNQSGGASEAGDIFSFASLAYEVCLEFSFFGEEFY